MITSVTSQFDPAGAALDLQSGPLGVAHAAAACGSDLDTRRDTGQPSCEIRRMRPRDVAAVKDLFRKLHMFNASLDPRFALSETWDSHFDAVMRQALLCDDEWLCLLASDWDTGRPMGFALATVHHDSGMWHYTEWVEVEAL